MNRRIAALTIAITAVFGLTACSGGSTDTTEPSNGGGSSSAPEDGGSSDQSVLDACLSLAGPMEEASSTMAEVANAANDPQSAVDAWTALTDAFGDFAGSVTNEEVKAAATAVHEDTGAMRDAIAKIYVDGDMGALSELTAATTDWQESYTALVNLCS